MIWDKLKGCSVYFADKPIHFCALSSVVIVCLICGTVCVFFMSSCEARVTQERYKYYTERDRVLWEKNK